MSRDDEESGEGSRPSTRWPRVWLSSALLALAPFALLAVFLALHKMGKMPPVTGLTYESTLILNLVLYWLIASTLIAVWRLHDRASGWLRKQAPQLLVLAISSLFSLGVAEVAVRLVRPDLAVRPFERVPSKTLHHANAANRSSLGMGNQRVVTNSDGLRTPYSREDFLGFDQRVVLLGDSYTFGLGVAGKEAVGSVLEQHLRDRLAATGDEPSVAVLNTGVISFSPYLERQMFRRVAAAYQPTLTLLLLDINDIGDDYQYRQENVSGQEDDPLFDVPEVDDSTSLCDFSALCRALGPVWERLGRPLWVVRRVLDLVPPSYDYYDFKVEIEGRTERNRFFVLRYPLESSRPFLDATWRNIEAVAHDVEASGSKFVLVVMPRYFHWNDAECPDNWEKDRYGVDEPFENVYLEYFDQRAATSPFPVWSLLPAFSAASKEGPLVFKHDPHWNSLGHRVAGAALASWLIEAGWPALAAPPANRLSFSTGPDGPTEGSKVVDELAGPGSGE